MHISAGVDLLRRMVTWLAPGGWLVLEEPDFGMWAGCNLNRNVEAAVSSSGFTLAEVKTFQLFSDTFLAAYPYKSIRAVRS